MSDVLNNPRWQAKLRSMLGLEQENPIPTVSDISVSVPIEADRMERELPGSVNCRMHGAVVAAGGAGNNSVLALVNNAGSGVLCIIEHVASSGVTGYSTVPINQLANYTNLGPSLPRDLRGSGGSGGQLLSRNNAAAPAEIGRFYGAGAPLDRSPYGIIVLPPGGPIMAFWNVTVNALFEGTLHWREVPIDFLLAS